MADMTPEVAAALRKPFPPALIGKLPRAGITLDYCGHATVTDRLLQVDPTWTWEPLATDEHGLPLLDKAGNLWIKLTIAGVTRLGVGDGKSAKEIVGDAIRNAAMRFGVALDLWAKEDLHAVESDEPAAVEAPATRTVRRQPRDPAAGTPLVVVNTATGEMSEPVPSAGTITEPQLKKMGALMREAQIVDRADALAFVAGVIGREVDSRNDLSKYEAGKVIDRLESLGGGRRIVAEAEPTLEEDR